MTAAKQYLHKLESQLAQELADPSPINGFRETKIRALIGRIESVKRTMP
jgi:hypothetical protein